MTPDHKPFSLVEISANPLPPGATVGNCVTPDGVALRYAYWHATGAPLKGTVTILQGRAEFIEKYFETIGDLRAHGHAVVAFDWRGQGGSDRLLKNPRRGHVDDFDDFLVDLDTILTEVSLANLPGPHYALAHSTGAAILLHGAERLRTRFDRAVLLSPLIGLGKVGWPQPLISPLAHGLSALGLGTAFVPGGRAMIRIPFEGNPLSGDRRRYERTEAILNAAPWLEIGAPTVDWLAAACRVLKGLMHPDFGPKMNLPVLIVAAGEDRIVSTRVAERFARMTRSARYLEIPGARHEILMEQDFYRDQAMAAIEGFFSAS